MAKTEVKATNITDEDRRFLERNRDKLSDSTLRARWVHEPSERPDRHGQTLATRSHEVIRAWAEARGATPATVEGSKFRDGPGVLRFDFGAREDRLVPLEWDELFEIVDRRQLVFVFQETMKDGTQSNFFIFDRPEREDG